MHISVSFRNDHVNIWRQRFTTTVPRIFPFNMVERLWYILLCFVSNSHFLLLTSSLSLWHGTALQARVEGYPYNESTVHIVLQRSTAEKATDGCPKGYYDSESDRRGRRAGRSTDTGIVGRSGNRRSESDRSKEMTLQLCLPCTVCEREETVERECTETRDTICRKCSVGVEPPCRSVSYQEIEILATHAPPSAGNPAESPGVKVTVDLSGQTPETKGSKKSEPQDLNINIQKAGRDERNSWYFLSLCALIGLLVFLSLVMGAYLVSVKVTSWWRYQRPVTVRRRGQSFNDDNQINMTTFPSSHFDEIHPPPPVDVLSSRSRDLSHDITPRIPMRLQRGSEVAEASFPSTSAGLNQKIHVVHLRGRSSEFDSSLDSFLVDARGYSQHRFRNQHYATRHSWVRSEYAYNDSSSYSSDDDEEEEENMGESGAQVSASQPPASLLQKHRGNHIYHSVPLSDVMTDAGSDCEVHLVQWPHVSKPGYQSLYQSCYSVGSGREQAAYAPRGSANQHPIQYSNHRPPPLQHNDPPGHGAATNRQAPPHTYATQEQTGAISPGSLPDICMEICPITNHHHHHSLPHIQTGDPTNDITAAAAPLPLGQKYDHQLSDRPRCSERTECDRGNCPPDQTFHHCNTPGAEELHRVVAARNFEPLPLRSPHRLHSYLVVSEGEPGGGQWAGGGGTDDGSWEDVSTSLGSEEEEEEDEEGEGNLQEGLLDDLTAVCNHTDL